MKILVIGGSYFLGRVFTMLAGNKHELTLVNRGRYQMNRYTKNEYYFDRHDAVPWQRIPAVDFDACIDFCAYKPNDIRTVLENFKGTIKQYIFVSTCDVYQRQTGILKNEDHPLETIHYDGEIGQYIFDKIQLEKELLQTADQYGFKPTILRPANIYGPFNYAPRESQYISQIINHFPLLEPLEADGQFQLVYVKDAAKALLLMAETPSEKTAFNLAAPEILNYHLFYEALKKAADTDCEIIPCPYQEAIRQNYPLCYPVFKHETELYDGSAITQAYPFQYTSLSEGLAKTYQAFYPVFKKE